MKNIKIAAIIGVVVIAALMLAKTAGFTFDKGGLSLLASKKDTVTVQDIDKSKVGVENRDGQDIKVDGVKNDSTVNIK